MERIGTPRLRRKIYWSLRSWREITAVAHLASSIDLVTIVSWGSASLHPRLYASPAPQAAVPRAASLIHQFSNFFRDLRFGWGRFKQISQPFAAAMFQPVAEQHGDDGYYRDRQKDSGDARKFRS